MQNLKLTGVGTGVGDISKFLNSIAYICGKRQREIIFFITLKNKVCQARDKLTGVGRGVGAGVGLGVGA
jgi:hypothetical protein